VQDVRSEVKEGDQILVKVVSIDPSGKIRLSRKALLEEAQGGAPGPDGGGSRSGGEARHDEHRPRGEHRGGGHHGEYRGGDRSGPPRGDRGRRDHGRQR
jgi:polyribonucleotide nucleotidyltransferase